MIQDTLGVTHAWDDDKRIEAHECERKDTLNVTLAWDDDKRIEAKHTNVKGKTKK